MRSGTVLFLQHLLVFFTNSLLIGFHMLVGCIICYCIFLCFLWSVVSFNYYLFYFCLDNNQPCPKGVSKGNDEEGPLFSHTGFYWTDV